MNKPRATSPAQPFPKHNAHAVHLEPGFPTDHARSMAYTCLDMQERGWPDHGGPGQRGGGKAKPQWHDGLHLDLTKIKPQVIASANGRIELILLCYPAGPTATPLLQNIFTHFIKSFPDAKFAVLTQRAVHKDVDAFVAKAGAAKRTTVLLAPDFAEFTIWCEDPFQVANDTAGSDEPPFLLKPYTFVRGGDDMVADCVANQMHFRHAQLPLIWQGGNVLAGDTFVLVGADYLAASATLLKPTGSVDTIVKTNPDESAVNTAFTLFRTTMDTTREFIFVGTKLPLPVETKLSDGVTTQTLFDGVGLSQPIFHIDMFISLIGRTKKGKYRLAVGSPKMADTLLGRRSLPQNLDEQFDDLAERLGTHPELEVIRSPLPLEEVQSGNDVTWYYATACNNIVEIIDEKNKTVWLPEYGFGDKAYLKVIDEYHAKLWRDMGFKVVGLGNFNPVAACFGAAHCLKKILVRKPGPAYSTANDQPWMVGEDRRKARGDRRKAANTKQKATRSK
jgi:hypothetical protein